MDKIFKFPKWHVPPPIIHILVWAFVYLIPFVFMPYGNENAWRIRYITSVPFIVYIFSFYVNYSFLIPKFLFAKRLIVYCVVNLAMFWALSYFVEFWRSHIIEIGILSLSYRPHFLGTFQNVLGFVLMNGIAVAVRSTTLWFASKNQIQELEIENAQAKLSSLKMQISPHFLFNTLNNILVLIDENSELAKKSVQQLSKLLRSMLYEFEKDFISIKLEAQFLSDYSDLMMLRYGSGLKFKLDADLGEPDAPIAPLLLMPLLENAFKHGVGPSPDCSSISIKIASKNGKILFESVNTYFPKTNHDKSGSGIGIDNTKKRLEMLYEDRYHYDCRIDGENYITKLELKT